MKKIVFIGSVVALASCAGLLAGRGQQSGSSSGSAGGSNRDETSAFRSNDIANKYIAWDDQFGNSCHEIGTLEKYQKENCNTELENCEVGVRAIEGKLEPEYVEMFADMVRMHDRPPNNSAGRPEQERMWKVHASCVRDGTGFFRAGINGLGNAKASQHVGLLAALANQEELSKPEGEGKGRSRLDLLGSAKYDLVRAFWWMNAKDQIPTMFEVMKEPHYASAQPLGLEILKWWNSDAAVDWCNSVLTSSKEESSTVDACIGYLGDRRSKAAVPILLRNLEQRELTTARALGLIGDAAAKDALEERLAKYSANQVHYLSPILAALANLGSKTHWGKLKALMQSGADISYPVAEAVYLRAELPFAGEVNQALKAVMNNKSADWQGRVAATVALANRGDADAVKKIIADLQGSNSEVRERTLDMIGGEFERPSAATSRRILGVVPDAQLIPALLQFRSLESGESLKQKALRAALHVRAAIDAKAK